MKLLSSTASGVQSGSSGLNKQNVYAYRGHAQLGVSNVPLSRKGHFRRISVVNHRNVFFQRHRVLCFPGLDFQAQTTTRTLRHLGSSFSNFKYYFQRKTCLLQKEAGLENIKHLVSVEAKSFWEAASIPFAKTVLNKEPENKEDDFSLNSEIYFAHDQSFNSKTSRGHLSPATVNSIERFSQLSGLNGKKMKAIFDANAPLTVQNEARNLVEYCCFRYLARRGADFNPSIKDVAFRRLTFITMLAWQWPYLEDIEKIAALSQPSGSKDGNARPVKTLVGEDAFVRIAPAIVGAADRATAHHLFKALTDDSDGLSFAVWETYLKELCRVHEERDQYCMEEGSKLALAPGECVLCVGANKREPLQKWNKNNIAWPGRLTLTDRALYFEANGLTQHQKPIRLCLEGTEASVERHKVGPFGAPLFDSAILLTSKLESEPWVLEFVDFSGEGRRDVWFAFINEIISVYSFIQEYSPAEDDPFLQYVNGSKDGRRRAVTAAIHGIARVQAVQSVLGRAPKHPERLLQFSYLFKAPGGDLVLQSLAVGFWAGRLEPNSKELVKGPIISTGFAAEEALGTGLHAVGTDGSVYLRRWMISPTWESGKSRGFWKQKLEGKGMVLGKDLVVGGQSHIERAVKSCKDQSWMIERTKATIDAALLKGIPSNIDLLKELMLPFTVTSMSFLKLRRWEDPPLTVLFLSATFVIIYKNWLRFVFPATLLIGAGLLLALQNLKAQGRLGDGFGRVTIKEQPPSNTLQKIMALREALTEVELQIQKLNIILLKLRTVALSGQPQITNEVLLALVGSAFILLFIPFRYLCVFFILDQFTRELEFRRKTVLKFMSHLKEWWETIPASPVLVLPHETDEQSSSPEMSEKNLTRDGMIAEALSLSTRVGGTFKEDV